MLVISKRMVSRWCKVDGQPGYLLTTGAKVKQTSVRFEEEQCESCHKTGDKRHEAYVRRFGLCVSCHAKKLFPDSEEKRGKFLLNMSCLKTLVLYGARYSVDQMTRTVVRQVM